MTVSFYNSISLSEFLFLLIILYVVAFCLLLWIRYCVRYSIFCPLSPSEIHCCFVPTTNQKETTICAICKGCQQQNIDICTECSMKNGPPFVYCCRRRHNLYDCCECPKVEIACFRPQLNIVCCCWKCRPSNVEEKGKF